MCATVSRESTTFSVRNAETRHRKRARERASLSSTTVPRRFDMARVITYVRATRYSNFARVDRNIKTFPARASISIHAASLSHSLSRTRKWKSIARETRVFPRSPSSVGGEKERAREMERASGRSIGVRRRGKRRRRRHRPCTARERKRVRPRCAKLRRVDRDAVKRANHCDDTSAYAALREISDDNRAKHGDYTPTRLSYLSLARRYTRAPKHTRRPPRHRGSRGKRTSRLTRNVRSGLSSRGGARTRFFDDEILYNR